MTTVASVFGKQMPVHSAAHPSIVMQCGVGIELELEGQDHISVRGWNCTEDGSLRNGCELVCARPYNGQELFRAIHNLSEAVKDSGAEGTWRCSTHVHMDMRDADSNIAKKTILAWAFYEKMMFKCSGYHRYRSNFCPAFAVVQAQVMNASEAFNLDGRDFFNRLVDNWDKYTSLNLLPLHQFGSFEFRISEPKWKRGQLLNLVNRFLMLKKLAVDNAELSNDEFVEKLNRIRFEPMLEHLPLDYVPEASDLNEGYRLARDILYCRSYAVEQAGRIRIRRSNGNGDPLIRLSDMSDFNGYMGYVRSNGRRVHEEIRERFGTQLDNGHATESQIRTMFQMMRDSGSNDNNVTDYVPNQLEGQLDSIL